MSDAEQQKKRAEEAEERRKQFQEFKAKAKKMKPGYFQIPHQMRPGMSRAGVGRKRPGDVVKFPDAAWIGEKPSLKLIPRDEDAYKLLVQAWGAEAVRAQHGDAPVTEQKKAPPPVDESKTSGRQADQ